ncbi:hypothetical protein CEXT_79431, partial [Caerostris extrusa]
MIKTWRTELLFRRRVKTALNILISESPEIIHRLCVLNCTESLDVVDVNDQYRDKGCNIQRLVAYFTAPDPVYYNI